MLYVVFLHLLCRCWLNEKEQSDITGYGDLINATLPDDIGRDAGEEPEGSSSGSVAGERGKGARSSSGASMFGGELKLLANSRKKTAEQLDLYAAQAAAANARAAVDEQKVKKLKAECREQEASAALQESDVLDVLINKYETVKASNKSQLSKTVQLKHLSSQISLITGEPFPPVVSADRRRYNAEHDQSEDGDERYEEGDEEYQDDCNEYEEVQSRSRSESREY